MDVDDDGAACKTPGGDTITYSNRDGRYLIHYSRLYNVECGRTKAIDNDNYHYDYRNRFIGSDRIDGKSVKHYDGDGNSIGESRVVSGGEVPQLKSNRLAGELERMAKRGGLADPRIAEKYQEIERIMSVCNTTYPPRWCQDSHIRVANLLRQLEN
ncbi:hypothetical protein LNKW23_17790 [Paralimibaculum aggregatum]|uniref:RHS repeat-associated core domain-containing protein n=1 Tax=Paralimibaculum aggregatum TaxID=3036245 RepID=A0ABQ6LPV7_9RHOB|nr:hypothetical protein LNKW23_17790 [Limibaculum sp. NKW23]